MDVKNEVMETFVKGLEGEDLYLNHDGLTKAAKKLRSDLLIAKMISEEVFGEDVSANTLFSVYDFLAREQFLNTFTKALSGADQQQAQQHVNKLFGGKGFKGVN